MQGQCCWLRDLVSALVKKNVDYIKRHRTAADYHTCGHSAPKNIGAGKLPDGEERGHDSDQDAGARRPKRNSSHGVRIEITSSLRAPRRLFFVFHVLKVSWPGVSDSSPSIRVSLEVDLFLWPDATQQSGCVSLVRRRS